MEQKNRQTQANKIQNARKSDVRNSALHPERRKKKRRRSVWIAVYFLALFAIALTMLILSLTVFFPVTTIRVKGETRYSSEEIIAASRIPTGKNLFTTDVSEAEAFVCQTLPYIGKVTIKREFPSTLVLQVQETAAALQLEHSGQYTVLDESGKMLETAALPVRGIPVVRGVTPQSADLGKLVKIKEESIRETLDEIYSELKRQEISPVTVINLSSPMDVRVTYANKFVLQLGSTANLTAKLTQAKQILKERETSGQTGGILNLSYLSDQNRQTYFQAKSPLDDSDIADVLETD